MMKNVHYRQAFSFSDNYILDEPDILSSHCYQLNKRHDIRCNKSFSGLSVMFWYAKTVCEKTDLVVIPTFTYTEWYDIFWYLICIILAYRSHLRADNFLFKAFVALCHISNAAITCNWGKVHRSFNVACGFSNTIEIILEDRINTVKNTQIIKPHVEFIAILTSPIDKQYKKLYVL